VSAFFINTKC